MAPQHMLAAIALAPALPRRRTASAHASLASITRTHRFGSCFGLPLWCPFCCHRARRRQTNVLQARRTYPTGRERRLDTSYRHQGTGVENPRLPQRCTRSRRRPASPGGGLRSETASGAQLGCPELPRPVLSQHNILACRDRPNWLPHAAQVRRRPPEAKQLRGRTGCVKAAAAGGPATAAYGVAPHLLF